MLDTTLLILLIYVPLTRQTVDTSGCRHVGLLTRQTVEYTPSTGGWDINLYAPLFNGSAYDDMAPVINLLMCGVDALSPAAHRLVGLVVKASASRAEDPGFESRFHRIFSGSSHTSDLKIGIPVATLPGAWRYRVSTGTGRPGVSIL